MKRKLSIFLLLCLTTIGCVGQRSLSQEQKMAWWQEAKFGMFVHWGPYSCMAECITDISNVVAVPSG